jgi:hypothetical protein
MTGMIGHHQTSAEIVTLCFSDIAADIKGVILSM